jgi:hypothetical protein
MFLNKLCWQLTSPPNCNWDLQSFYRSILTGAQINVSYNSNSKDLYLILICHILDKETHSSFLQLWINFSHYLTPKMLLGTHYIYIYIWCEFCVWIKLISSIKIVKADEELWAFSLILFFFYFTWRGFFYYQFDFAPFLVKHGIMSQTAVDRRQKI